MCSSKLIKIGLIAGGGQFPVLFAQRAIQQGYQVFAVGFHGETNPELSASVQELTLIHLGQVSRLIRFFQANGVQETVMVGSIRKTNIFKNIKPDLKALSFIAKTLVTHDDKILSSVAALLFKEGIKIVPSTFLMPEIISPRGCWTKKKPDHSQKKDIHIGWKIASKIGELDIGQCVVIGNGTVLAVEAVEGTDAAIIRAGELSLKSGAVVVKRCKPLQDLRFDLPATGLTTVETMIKAGVSVLALEAGKSVVFDRDTMIDLANLHGISIIGMTDDDMV